MTGVPCLVRGTPTTRAPRRGTPIMSRGSSCCLVRHPLYSCYPSKESAGIDYFLGTDRLDRSTQRLKASQALANDTEAIGASTLAQLQQQRETIDHTTRVLYESEGYVDRSLKSLKGIARRYDVAWRPVTLLWRPLLTLLLEWLRIG